MSYGSMARHRFLLQEQVETSKNAHGEPIYAWRTRYYFSGVLEFKSGNETSLGGVQQQAIATHQIKMHYRKDHPKPNNRIMTTTTKFEVVAVGDPDGYGKQITLSLRQLDES